MPAPDLPGVLLAWRFEVLPLAGVAIATLAYLWAVRQVARRHRSNPPPRWRTAAFLAGMAAIVVALCSPIEAYEGQLFSVHMVQHMLLELVAAPLILLGAPMTLTLRVASPWPAPGAADRPAQPRGGGADLPLADLARLCRRQLGLALQHSL